MPDHAPGAAPPSTTLTFPDGPCVLVIDHPMSPEAQNAVALDLESKIHHFVRMNRGEPLVIVVNLPPDKVRVLALPVPPAISLGALRGLGFELPDELLVREDGSAVPATAEIPRAAVEVLPGEAREPQEGFVEVTARLRIRLDQGRVPTLPSDAYSELQANLDLAQRWARLRFERRQCCSNPTKWESLSNTAKAEEIAAMLPVVRAMRAERGGPVPKLWRPSDYDAPSEHAPLGAAVPPWPPIAGEPVGDATSHEDGGKR